jgi:prefoldin subunit 5
MQNEIPAGTKVKVAVTQKGVTTYQDAEVLAHMDGLVHVDMNGDAVSVDPSQIVTGDAPASDAAVAIVGTDSGNSKIAAELIAQLSARVDTLESDGRDIMAAIADLQTRLTAVEKPIDAAAPAAQPSTTGEESTAPAVSAEPSGDGQATDGPEATAGATGQ